MKPAPLRWRWECRNTALFAAIWSAVRTPPISLQQMYPLIRELVQFRELVDCITAETEE